MEQQGLRKELESAEEDKEVLQQRLLVGGVPAPRHACYRALPCTCSSVLSKVGAAWRLVPVRDVGLVPAPIRLAAWPYPWDTDDAQPSGQGLS